MNGAEILRLRGLAKLCSKPRERGCYFRHLSPVADEEIERPPAERKIAASPMPAGTANNGSSQERWLVCRQKTNETVT